MRLGRKIDHRARSVLGQQLAHQGAVANIALHEHMPGIVLERGQGFQIARVSELVQVQHWLIALREPIQYKIGADKTGPACDENHVNAFARVVMLIGKPFLVIPKASFCFSGNMPCICRQKCPNCVPAIRDYPQSSNMARTC